jgi:hypothetical protein
MDSLKHCSNDKRVILDYIKLNIPHKKKKVKTQEKAEPLNLRNNNEATLNTTEPYKNPILLICPLQCKAPARIA